ncbi:zinc finger (CCCH type) protein, related, partial [Neospora caninum Liverpool]
PPASPENILVPASLRGSTISTIFFKTKMCRFLRQGRCKHGPSCQFAHSPEELRTPPNLAKTRLCRAFREGRCDRGENCAFAHGLVDLRGTGEIYKTQICIFWPAGHGNRVSEGGRHAVGVADHPPWDGERGVASHDGCGPSLTSTRAAPPAPVSQPPCGRGFDEQRSSRPVGVCRSPLHTEGSAACMSFGSVAAMGSNGSAKGTRSRSSPYGSGTASPPSSTAACSAFAASPMSFSPPIVAPPASYSSSRATPRTVGSYLREQAAPVAFSHVCHTSDFPNQECAPLTSSQPPPTQEEGLQDFPDMLRRMKPLCGVVERSEDAAVKRPSEICSKPKLPGFPEGHLSSEKARSSVKVAKSMRAQFRPYAYDAGSSVLSSPSSCAGGFPVVDLPAGVGTKQPFGSYKLAHEATQSHQNIRLPASVHTGREIRGRGLDTSEHNGGCKDITDRSVVKAVTSAASGELAGVECHASRQSIYGRPVLEQTRSMLVVSFPGAGRSGRSRDTVGTWKRTAPPIPPPPPLSSSFPSQPFRCGESRASPDGRTPHQSSGCIDSNAAIKAAASSVPLLVSPWGDVSDRNTESKTVASVSPTPEVGVRRSHGPSSTKVRQHWHPNGEQRASEILQHRGASLANSKPQDQCSSSGAYLMPARVPAALDVQTRDQPGCTVRGTGFCRAGTEGEKGGHCAGVCPTGVCQGAAALSSGSQNGEKHGHSVPAMHVNRGERELDQQIFPTVNAMVQEISSVAQSQRRRERWDWGHETVTPTGATVDTDTREKKGMTSDIEHAPKNVEEGRSERRTGNSVPSTTSTEQAERPVRQTALTGAGGHHDPADIRGVMDLGPSLPSGGLFGSVSPYASIQGHSVAVVSPAFAPLYCHGTAGLDSSSGGLPGHGWPMSPVCAELGVSESLLHDDASLVAAAIRNVGHEFAVYPQRKEQETFGPGPPPPVIFVSASVPELLPSQVQLHPAGQSVFLCSPFPMAGPVADPTGPYFLLPSAGHVGCFDVGQEATLGFGHGVPAPGVLIPTELRGPWPVWGQGEFHAVGLLHTSTHEVQGQDCVPVGLAESSSERSVNKPADSSPNLSRFAVQDGVVDGLITQESDTGCSEAFDEVGDKSWRPRIDEPEATAQQDEPFRLPPVSRMHSALPTFPSPSREEEPAVQTPRSEEPRATWDNSGGESESSNSPLDRCTERGNSTSIGRLWRCRSVCQSRCGLHTFLDRPSKNRVQGTCRCYNARTRAETNNDDNSQEARTKPANRGPVVFESDLEHPLQTVSRTSGPSSELAAQGARRAEEITLVTGRCDPDDAWLWSEREQKRVESFCHRLAVAGVDHIRSW